MYDCGGRFFTEDQNIVSVRPFVCIGFIYLKKIPLTEATKKKNIGDEIPRWGRGGGGVKTDPWGKTPPRFPCLIFVLSIFAFNL